MNPPFQSSYNKKFSISPLNRLNQLLKLKPPYEVKLHFEEVSDSILTATVLYVLSSRVANLI